MIVLLKILLPLVIALAVILDALSDAIIDETNKRNHLTEMLTIGCFITVIFLRKYLVYNELIVILVYILMRGGCLISPIILLGDWILHTEELVINMMFG